MYTVTVKLMTDDFATFVEEMGIVFEGTHINSVTTLETTIIHSFKRYSNATEFIRQVLPHALKTEIKMRKP